MNKKKSKEFKESKESKESKEFRGQRIKAGIIEFEDKEKLQTLFIEVLKSSNK